MKKRECECARTIARINTHSCRNGLGAALKNVGPRELNTQAPLTYVEGQARRELRRTPVANHRRRRSDRSRAVLPASLSRVHSRRRRRYRRRVGGAVASQARLGVATCEPREGAGVNRVRRHAERRRRCYRH